MRETFAGKSTNALEQMTMVPETPEFYLILKEADLTDGLSDQVYESGFDDSSLTMRSGHAAIWICHREGELRELIKAALQQARRGGLEVLHVEIENEVFA